MEIAWPIRISSLALAAWATWIMATGDAKAYIDPASGSYFLQMLIATLVAAPFVIKGFFGRLRHRLRRVGPEVQDER